MKAPEVDLSRCEGCDVCVEVCPEVFKRNEAGGYIEVVELDRYPENLVREAMNLCRARCICWEKRNGGLDEG